MRFDSETGKKYGEKSSRKGVKDKFSLESMERIRRVLTQLDETLIEDIKSLPKNQRVKLWLDLQEYVNPKQQRTEIKGEITTGPKTIGYGKS